MKATLPSAPSKQTQPHLGFAFMGDPVRSNPVLWVFKKAGPNLDLSDWCAQESKDLKRLTAVHVHLRKMATDSDVINVAQKLKIDWDPDDLFQSLASSQKLVDALVSKGYDGATMSKDLLKEEHETKEPRLLVAFENAHVEVLQGVHKDVAVMRFQQKPVQHGAGWTSEHDEISSAISRGPHSIGIEQMAQMLENARAKAPGGVFDLNAISGAGANSLVLQAALCSMDHIKFLVEQGANPMARNGRFLTALHVAKDTDAIDWLISKGADVHAVDENGQTPLHRKASYDALGGLSRLIHWGADVNARDAHGQTPLHSLVRSNMPPESIRTTARVLINADADLDAKDNEGRSVLHRAAENGNNTLLVELIKAGANIDIEDSRGLRPIHLSVLKETQSMHHLIALGASTWGVFAVKTPMDNELCDSPLKASLRVLSADGADLLAESLRRFPDPSDDDLAWAKNWIKKKEMGPSGAVLSAHLARSAIDTAMEKHNSAAQSKP
jgi:ankyrin repeat protein